MCASRAGESYCQNRIQCRVYKPDSVSGILQGPVAQSVVSLTSSLRAISLTVLADSIYNIMIFLLKKCE